MNDEYSSLLGRSQGAAAVRDPGEPGLVLKVAVAGCDDDVRAAEEFESPALGHGRGLLPLVATVEIRRPCPGSPGTIRQDFCALTRPCGVGQRPVAMPPARTKEPRSPALAALGDAIVGCRERAGLSQEELADRADMHPTALGRIERGDRNLTFGTLVRVAAALGVRPGQLVIEADDILERRGS